MNTIATFENTVGILVKAYLNNTLLKGSCSACAVGNICAAALGTVVVEAERLTNGKGIAAWRGFDRPLWNRVFCSEQWSPNQDVRPYNYKGLTAKQIDATGYTWQQLARIEFAFEKAQNTWGEEAELAGLMAVVDVLADIHGIDLATAEVAKGLFVKA